MKYETGSRATDKKAKEMLGNLNYYDLLEVSPKASQAVIASAYRALCRKYHPDKNYGDKAAGEIMAKINIAYGVLSDELKRKMYDEELVERQKSGKGYSVEVKKSEPAAGVSLPVDSDSTSPQKISGSSATAAVISWGASGWVFIIVGLLGIYLIGQWIENTRLERDRMAEVQRESSKSNKWEFAENLLEGRVFPQNYEEALDKYTSMSKEDAFDDGRAEQRIAEMHFYGLGVPVDYQKALLWYEKASRFYSDGEPMFMLGVMHEEGLGVRADPIAAYRYFNTAQANFYTRRFFRNNSLLFARKERHVGGAHIFSADAAKQRKLALEKSMTIEQIKQAQNPLGKNENQ